MFPLQLFSCVSLCFILIRKHSAALFSSRFFMQHRPNLQDPFDRSADAFRASPLVLFTLSPLLGFQSARRNHLPVCQEVETLTGLLLSDAGKNSRRKKKNNYSFSEISFFTDCTDYFPKSPNCTKVLIDVCTS